MRDSPATIGEGRAPGDSTLHLPVTLIGRAARRALATGLAWRVFAV